MLGKHFILGFPPIPVFIILNCKAFFLSSLITFNEHHSPFLTAAYGCIVCFEEQREGVGSTSEGGGGDLFKQI